jgi:hypothetical protein
VANGLPSFEHIPHQAGSLTAVATPSRVVTACRVGAGSSW